MTRPLTCTFPGCGKTCRSFQGLQHHKNSAHRPVTPKSDDEGEDTVFQTIFHPKLTGEAVLPTIPPMLSRFLTAKPCDIHGALLPPHSLPPTEPPKQNPFEPFTGRVAFQWADYHFTKLQSSAAEIGEGLDLWLASTLEAGGQTNGVPWTSAEQMYSTIDEIQNGPTPWQTIKFKYSGPLPASPPKWMLQEYELSLRDARAILHEQISCSDFKDSFSYVPYEQYNSKKDRVWSNLMSATWAWNQADKVTEAHPEMEGAMLVSAVHGMDKTCASNATGHQEFHPVYVGPGNITNPARRAHQAGMRMVAVLPIPRTSKKHRKSVAFQRFSRQLYHACMARIFAPLRPYMENQPDIVKCPDGHFRRAIYSLGPSIADYPEQVWLAGIVQGWCPKCEARPEFLDNPTARLRNHERTNLLFECYDHSHIWDEYGFRNDIVPYTYGFPRANIHELLSPDLLHQLIKGCFKDHLVEFVQDYIHASHTTARANEIIQDIDRRISGVPIYPGLRRFPDGRDFTQWTGDDSKALMKVYLAAIEAYIPTKMVQCISALINCCYIARKNAITASDIDRLHKYIARFHETRSIFIEVGVRDSMSLPRQHALMHYPRGIELFGSPNGLCSSITESLHIRAIKEPWRRSSRNRALPQMLRTITRLEKMASLRRSLNLLGLLRGTAASFVKASQGRDGNEDAGGAVETSPEEDELTEDKDCGPSQSVKTLSSIKLATTRDRSYPRYLNELAAFIGQPRFPQLLTAFIYKRRHPNTPVPPLFTWNGKIDVFHSAIARFHAPSDTCGAGGMYRERIRCNPSWTCGARYDTVFVEMDSDQGDAVPAPMNGLTVARVLLLFSFYDEYYSKRVPCALVTWYPLCSEVPDHGTGMWVVEPEYEDGEPSLQVLPLDTIMRGAHLLPRYGREALPEDFHFSHSLDAFRSFFVNHFIDYHCYELLNPSLPS